MIKVLGPTKRLIRCIITDKNALENKIKGHISSLGATDIFLPMENKVMALDVFKRILVYEIDKKIKIKDNVGYIVESNLDENLIRFSFTRVESEKLGSGYSIALTLQD